MEAIDLEPATLQDPSSSDETLMDATVRGDRLAYAELVKRHAPGMYRVAYRILLHRGDAEDAVQEAFLKLWGRDCYWDASHGTAFKTWFKRIVVNLCLDFKRRKKPVYLDVVPDVEDDAPDAEALLYKRQMQTLVAQAVAALPKRERAALSLCHYEEASNKEAAEIMGIGVKALESLLVRARKSVRDYVQRKGFLKKP